MNGNSGFKKGAMGNPDILLNRKPGFFAVRKTRVF